MDTYFARMAATSWGHALETHNRGIVHRGNGHPAAAVAAFEYAAGWAADFDRQLQIAIELGD